LMLAPSSLRRRTARRDRGFCGVADGMDGLQRDDLRSSDIVTVLRAGNSSELSYASIMKLGFEESQTAYTSGSQSARAWTEAWVKTWAFAHTAATQRFPLSRTIVRSRIFSARHATKNSNSRARRGSSGPELSMARSRRNASGSRRAI